MHLAQSGLPAAFQTARAKGRFLVPVAQNNQNGFRAIAFEINLQNTTVMSKCPATKHRHMVTWVQICKPPENKFIELTVEVQEATVSLLLGSNWLNIDSPDAPDRQALSEVWQSFAMAHSAAATYAATAMSDMDTLSQLVQCKHTDTLPASAAQSTLTAAAMESASAASRPLVLLIHALGAVAVSRETAVVPGLCNLQLEAEMKELALQQSSGNEHIVSPELKQQDDLTALIRCAILLLKLADLTPAKPAEDASVALWLAIGRLVCCTAFDQHGDPPIASVC